MVCPQVADSLKATKTIRHRKTKSYILLFAVFIMDCILNSIMAYQLRTSGGQSSRSPVLLSVLEPTPIDRTRIITVPKVPFDSSPLGKIKDETVLAALCDVFKSHEQTSLLRSSSSSSTPMVGLSPKMTSLLLEAESICNDREVHEFSKNPEGVSSWSEDGLQRLRNVEILVDFDNEDASSSSCSTTGSRDVHKVNPTTGRRNFSPCCSPKPSCNTTIHVHDNNNNKSSTMTSSVTSSTSRSEFHMMCAGSSSSTTTTFRINQTEQWYQRYLDLVKFRERFGHCLVPLNWPTNPSLAHWVKRQRHQYRAKKERKHSTLTPDRQRLLEQLGFVWDSHASGWEERLKELQEFREKHGHCRVPKTYAENPQLAIWVKCQRRQFKLYSEGKDSNMTMDRIHKLKRLGFVFTPRKQQRGGESVFIL